MTDPSPKCTNCLFAVKLLACDAAHPGRLTGRLEHVLSGRRHDFADGAALLALLAREQSEAYSIDPAKPGPVP